MLLIDKKYLLLKYKKISGLEKDLTLKEKIPISIDIKG